jgi:hypothetical protein
MMSRPSEALGPAHAAGQTGRVDDDAAEARAIADRLHATFNARDVDGHVALFADDVRIDVDSVTLQGRAAARARMEAVVATYPGILTDRRQTVAATADTVVSEHRLLNPNDTADDDEHRTTRIGGAVSWRLEGLVCEILRIRGGRITSWRSYYQPSGRDRTPVAELPSRQQAALIADEQAALRDVASGVARGASASEVFLAVDRRGG